MNKAIPATGELQPTADNFTGAAAITPSDSTAVAFDAIWVGGAGNVEVDMSSAGAGVTFASVPAGTLLRVGVTKVYAATTATNLIGLDY